MNPMVKARAAAALLAIDALVHAPDATWEEKRDALVEMNAEDNGDLEELLNWFGGSVEDPDTNVS